MFVEKKSHPRCYATKGIYMIKNIHFSEVAINIAISHNPTVDKKPANQVKKHS